MKLIRFGEPGNEKPGIIQGEKRFDVSSFGQDFGELFFENNGLVLLQKFVGQQLNKLPEIPEGTRLGPPVTRPSKLICIGLNYADHAKETNAPIPKEPIIFFKSTTAIIGPNDDVIIPRGSVRTDWEVELAVVIGKKASYVTEAEALHHVAGYCLHNDYSEREFQMERGGQWTKGKSCDTFAPLGPFLATPDEIADVHTLRLWLTVNGNKMQESNTSNLIFKIPFLVHYVSQFMTLLPGDIISTGTPGGVGLAMKPPVYLKSGDVVSLGVDGLGSSTQHLRSYPRDN
jgi:2,4-didehydro-3-deoxy-L-rhamnonate hydrolase